MTVEILILPKTKNGVVFFFITPRFHTTPKQTHTHTYTHTHRPPRAQLLLDESEVAGEEPAEGLLHARMACCVPSPPEGLGDASDLAFESFWVPLRGATLHGVGAGIDAVAAAAVGNGTEEDLRRGLDERGDEGAFFSFRVANRDNEVRSYTEVRRSFLFYF